MYQKFRLIVWKTSLRVRYLMLGSIIFFGFQSKSTFLNLSMCLDLLLSHTARSNSFLTPITPRKILSASHSLLCKSRDSIPKRRALNRHENNSQNRLSDHLFSIPSCRLHIVDPLCRMRSGWVFILAHERIRVILLLKVTQGMVNLPMLGLVCPNVQQ